MQAVPRSLGRSDAAPPPTRPGLSPFPRAARPAPPPDAVPADDLIEMPDLERRTRPGAAGRAVRAMRLLRVGRRFVLVMGWTAIACVVQSAMLMLPGRGKKLFARRYWSVVATLLGLRIRVLGRVAVQPVPGSAEGPRRPVIFVCNHSSWLDVPVLGGRLLACFVAKEDVGRWPVVGTVARLGRTIFVSRHRRATGRERDDMRLRLAGGDDLILFPEGTSSDGSRVLPFHSSFFAAAKPNGADQRACLADVPLIQPVSVVYDRLGGMPVGRSARTVFSWYGDMDLASHFARLGRWRGMRATILLHPVLDPALFGSRKALSVATWTAVAEGAAALRQNRIDDRMDDNPVKTAPQPGTHQPAEAFLLDSDGPSFA